MRQQLDMKFIKKANEAILPRKANSDDTGMDVWCITNEDIVVRPQSRHIFKTGLGVIIPEGWSLTVADRSSIGSKGITYCAGEIDRGYTGEIGIILTNTVDKPFVVTTCSEEEVLSSKFFDLDRKTFITADFLSRYLELTGSSMKSIVLTENIIIKYTKDAIAQLKLTEVPYVSIDWATEEEAECYKNKFTRGDNGYGSSNSTTNI
ncbi:MAG: hypothetical protein ACRC5M_05275 [Anaeroplasmataceae bacterium]